MRPNARSIRIKRFVGYALIAAIWSALLVIIAVFAIDYAICADIKAASHSRLTAGTGLEVMAESIFMRRFWWVWQAEPTCAQFDPELIYLAKPGRANFRNPEFDTIITMQRDGRREQPAPPPGHREKVVVLGDSFAMGWGVNDAETYSAPLQSRFHYATTNLGVASYGTARELLWLRRQDAWRDADVLIIQFCENDAEENAAFLENPRLFESSAHAEKAWKEVSARPRYELNYPSVLGRTVDHLYRRVRVEGVHAMTRSLLRDRHLWQRGRDSSHSLARDFLAVWDRFPALADKPVIVIDPPGGAGFVADLQHLVANRPNFKVMRLQLQPEHWFRFDGHLKPAGHEAIAVQLDRAIREWSDRNSAVPLEAYRE
jgi:hypothetical protein